MNDRVPDFAVRVDGVDRTAELRPRVVSLEVREDLDLLGWFEIRLEPSILEGKGIDFLPVGSRLEIRLGHGKISGIVMVGDVTGISLDRDVRRGSVFKVRGLDPLHRLARAERTRTFRDVRYGDVAVEIARESGIRVEAEAGGPIVPHLLQANETDLLFLRRIARSAGCEVFWRDDRLIYRPPAEGEDVAFTIEGAGAAGAIAVDLTIVGQAGAVEVRGWDPSRREPIIGWARAGEVGPPMGGERSGPMMAEQSFPGSVRTFVDETVADPEDADRAARRHIGKLALEAVRGRVTLPGDPALRAGRIVDLVRFDRYFDGRYYLVGVEHRIDARVGYRCRLEMRRNAAGPRPSVRRARPIRSSPREAAPETGEVPVEIVCLDPSGEPVRGERYTLRFRGGRRDGETGHDGSIEWPVEAGEGSVEVDLRSRGSDSR